MYGIDCNHSKGVYLMDKKKTVLVCVTPQESSKLLVAAGKAIAEKNSATLQVVSVLPLSIDEESNINPKVIEDIHHAAKNAGGEMALYFSDEPILTAAAHIGRVKPVIMVTGFPGEDSNAFVTEIHLLFPSLPISMVDGEKVYNILPFESSQPVSK